MHSLNLFRKFSVAAVLMAASAFNVGGQTNVAPEIRTTEATNYMNQQVVVRDVVVQVALRQTVALLNLNQKFPHSPLTLVIRGNDTNHFPDLKNYLGQRVEVSGRITEYQGRPQIVLTTTNQIKILNAAQTNLNSLPAAGTPTPPAMVDQPAAIAAVTAQSAASVEPQPDRTVRWILPLFGAIIALLGLVLLVFWWRGLGNFGGRASYLALAQQPAPPAAVTDPAAVEAWKQRALVAEAMAGRQAQILREKLMPELAEFAKQSLVQGLYTQRNALIETQQVAQHTLAELEARLAALQLSLPERIRAYETRIGELEKVVEMQGGEMRELTRATLALVRKKLEVERQSESTPSRFN